MVAMLGLDEGADMERVWAKASVEPDLIWMQVSLFPRSWKSWKSHGVVLKITKFSDRFGNIVDRKSVV